MTEPTKQQASDERIERLLNVMLLTLKLNCADLTYGDVKTVLGLVVAEVLSDHEISCPCGESHDDANGEYLESVRGVTRSLVMDKREAKANPLAAVQTEGNA